MRDIKMIVSTSEVNNVGQIVVRQDDKGTQKLIAEIIENGQPKNLSGYTVFFNAMVNGGIIARDIAQTTGSSEVTYILKEAFYQKTGRIECFFSFEKDGKRESTADFMYHVVKGTCRNIYQGNYIYEFEQLKDVVGDIIGSQDLLPLLKQITEVDAKTESYKTDSDTKLNKVEKDLKQETKDHLDDKKNPHEVTAKQVGTMTSNEILKTVGGTEIFNHETGYYLKETEEIFYDFKKMNFGLFLIWGGYTLGDGPTNSHFETQVITKVQIDAFPGLSSVFKVGPTVQSAGQKMVYANRERLRGRKENAEGDNRVATLRKVIMV